MSMTAISLSGGGAKGDFQLGAIRLLYDRGIRPNILCSTSVGSVNAIKLAEGEHPGQPNLGLPGLEALWSSLQRNSDMFHEEDWLNDPMMDPRVRDFLTGHSAGLGISAPDPHKDRWGDLGWLVELISNVGFLIGDGAALLRSLNVFSSRARALYNLSPIGQRLETEVDHAAIGQWVSGGGRLRLAAVALESGRLRYITESGAVIERDGTSVLWPGPLTPACAAIQAEVDAHQADILSLQGDLREAAPGAKAQIVAQIRREQSALSDAIGRFETCVQAQPSIPLTVSLTEAVLASASIPGVFPPVQLGPENYVDGGVRELLPIQMAVGLGADVVYAVSAFTFNIVRKGSFTHALLGEILARSVEDLVLNEVALDDTRVQPPPASATPNIFLVAPDVEIHDVTTIDPGLIQINRDYGYMRAADVLDQVGTDTRRWALATEIARIRRDAWALENRRFGHEDPTRLADAVQPPDPGVQPQIDAAKNKLNELLVERRGVNGPTPPGIDRWTSTLELHPWAGMLNDAAFVAQNVPKTMVRGSSAAVSVTMRNTGTTTWTENDAYRLGSQAPQDNTVWGTNRRQLPKAVGPGDEVAFQFSVTAPPPPGAAFQWRMVQDGREWFGAVSPVEQVSVAEPAECAALRMEIRDLENEIASLQIDLANASPGEKARIAAEIRAAQGRLKTARTQYDQLGCN